MIQQPKTIEEITKILTEEYKIDKAAIHSLLTTRIPVNAEFGDKSIFFCNKDKNHDYSYVTPLGIINGILYELGINRIASSYEETTYKFLGFVPYDENVDE